MYLRTDGTPYYVGKGKDNRAFESYSYSRSVQAPADRRRILVQEHATEEEAFVAEKFLISLFGRKDLGTGCLRNHTDGGEGFSGLIRSAEHSRRIAESNRGRTCTVESRKRISDSHKGLRCSEQAKEKLRTANLGKTLSEEHKKKIGASNKRKRNEK